MKFLLILLSTLLFTEFSFAQSEDKSKSTPKVKENGFPVQKIESIMLDNEEMRKINKAFDLYDRGKEFIVEQKPEGLSEEELEKMKIKKLSEEMKLIKQKSRIFLGSILYFSDKIWSVWINDKKITSTSNKKENEIFIKTIDGKKIDLIWTLAVSKWKILMSSEIDPSRVNTRNQVKTKITLHPNQTYSLRENKITEGREKLSRQRSSKELTATKKVN